MVHPGYVPVFWPINIRKCTPAHNQSQAEHGGAWELVVSLARPLHGWGLTSETIELAIDLQGYSIVATSGLVGVWPYHKKSGCSGSVLHWNRNGVQRS